ncbi:hypothetical protein [Cereibacter sphaeroides]|uniref:hypothetical protein n=1 Tax=Cereibacter sphaeroides TaxID=1063 RepID=UPI003FCECDFC
MDRRSFLKSISAQGLIAAGAFGGGVAGGVTSAIGTSLYDKAIKLAGFGSLDVHLTDEQKRMAKRILLGNGLNTRVLPAAFNRVTGEGASTGMTPPAKYACDALVNLLEMNSRRIICQDNLALPGFSGNICIIGGPIANSLSELFFGQDGRSQIFEKDGEPLRLPMYLDNVAAMRDLENGLRFLERDGIRKPLWRIAINGHQIVPEHSKSFLYEDYMLITRIPNILDQFSYDIGGSLTFVAGANGVGTRAVRLLLSAEHILRKLFDETSQYDGPQPFWQALIHIASVDSDSDHPLEIGELVKFEAIKVDCGSLLRQSCRILRASE